MGTVLPYSQNKSEKGLLRFSLKGVEKNVVLYTEDYAI